MDIVVPYIVSAQKFSCCLISDTTQHFTKLWECHNCRIILKAVTIVFSVSHEVSPFQCELSMTDEAVVAFSVFQFVSMVTHPSNIPPTSKKSRQIRCHFLQAELLVNLKFSENSELFISIFLK